MSEHKKQDVEYDNTDLEQTSVQFNLPPPRQMESLGAFVNRMEAEESYPKDDMRKLWMKTSAEREKAMKQLRIINSRVEYWLYKRKFMVEVNQNCENTLQKLDAAIMSDIG